MMALQQVLAEQGAPPAALKAAGVKVAQARTRDSWKRQAHAVKQAHLSGIKDLIRTSLVDLAAASGTPSK